MSREVCGVCWCPYDEKTGECACAPPATPNCSNCASLEAQNTELDRKLADLEEALKEMLSVWEEDSAYGAKHADKARAAIAKVEGQA